CHLVASILSALCQTMSRSDTARTLLILDRNPIIATIERQLRAHGRPFLDVVYTGRFSSQNCAAIFGRVRKLVTDAAASRLRKHDVAGGGYVIGVVCFLHQKHIDG